MAKEVALGGVVALSLRRLCRIFGSGWGWVVARGFGGSIVVIYELCI